MKRALSKKQKALVDRASFWTTKDLAVKMVLHVRTVKEWWKRLRVPPDACNGHGCHRWTEKAAQRLMTAWRQYWLDRGTTPEIVHAKETGSYTYNDPAQLLLIPFTSNLNVKIPAKKVTQTTAAKTIRAGAPSPRPALAGRATNGDGVKRNERVQARPKAANAG